MKKIILSAVLTATGLGWGFAAPVNLQQAKTVAANFMSAQTGDQNVRVALTKTYGSTDQPALYIFSINGSGGFVIVSGDDAVKPVLGYSTENPFGVAPMSPQVNYWMKGYQQQIEAVAASGIEAGQEVTDKWTALLNGNATNVGNTAAKPTNVAPLLTTNWNQLPYYNVLCPAITPTQQNPTNNAPTGCVATAMAQIMKFWEAPVTGTGTKTYTSNSMNVTLTADFGNTTYDWANMPQTLTGASSSTQVDAVATLMLHCGVAVEMDYTADYSGAQVLDLSQNGYPSSETAFPTYFGYKSDIKGYRREDFSDSTWIKMLKFELDNGRPILYAGFGQMGGHAFDFDGYDNNNMFHINWGWGGLSDGYFTVDNLSPSALGTGGGGGNFNSGQQALVMIEPASSTLPANPFTPDDTVGSNIVLTINSPIVQSNDTIIYNTAYSVSTDIKNSGTDTFQGGALALVAVEIANQNHQVQLNYALPTMAPGDVYHYTYSTPGNVDLTEGRYMVVVVYLTSVTNPQAQLVLNGAAQNGVVLTVLADDDGNDDGNDDGDDNGGDSTAINELTLSRSFNVYPNPAQYAINLAWDEFDGKVVSVQLFDITGREVFNSATPSGQQLQIPVSELANGSYFLNVETDEGSFTKKVLIRK